MDDARPPQRDDDDLAWRPRATAMAPTLPAQRAAPDASIATVAGAIRPVEGELSTIGGVETPQFLPLSETDDEETESEIDLEMDVEGDVVVEPTPSPPRHRGRCKSARSDGETNTLEEEEAEPQSAVEPEPRHDSKSTPEEASPLAGRAPLASEPPDPGERSSDDSNDALLLRIVLAQPVNGTTARARIAFWDGIVTAFTAAGGVGVASRADVTKRLGVLTLTLFESPHLLIPSLRAMVLEFNEQNCRAGFASHLGGAFLTALSTHATDGRTTATSMRRPHPPFPNILKMKAVENEILLRLVMQHKPFEVDRKYRTSVWARICGDYNATRGGITSFYVRRQLNSRAAGECRLVAAMVALLTREYPHDTRTLRVMLIEYHILSIPGKAETIATGMDELFMRFVLEKRPYNAVLSARNQAWEDVVAAFAAAGGDQIEGRSGAIRHVAKLSKMLQERPQALSEQLRGMILDYSEQCYASGKWITGVAILERFRRNVRETLVASGETLRPPEQGTSPTQAINPPAEDAVGEQVDEQQSCAAANEEPMALGVADGKRASTCARPASASTTGEDIPHSDDELLMQTVLAHRPVETTVYARTSGWDTVVDAFIAAGGANVTTRADVTRRIGIMTLILFETPNLLTPRLREMVLEFNECNCKAGFAQRLRSAFLKTLRAHATEGTAVHGHPNERHGIHVEREQEGRERAREDEHLLRIVMKHRPFEAGTEGKTLYWVKILSEYNSTLDNAENSHRGLLRSWSTAQSCVVFATTALLNRTHWYHPFLSPRLRAKLLEFNLLNIGISGEMFRRPAEADPSSLPPAVMQVEEDEPAASHTTERSSKKPNQQVVSAKPPASTNSEAHTSNLKEPAGERRKSYLSKCEVFMRIVLEKRPFDAKTGDKRNVWDSVANAFSAASGDTVRGGDGAASRFGHLKRAMLSSPHLLPQTARRMILEYHEQCCASDGYANIDKGMLAILRKQVSLSGEPEGDAIMTAEIELTANVAMTSQSTSPSLGGGVGSARGEMVGSTKARNKRRVSPSTQENDIVPPKRRRTTQDDSIDVSGDDESTAVDETAFRVALERQPFLDAYGLRRDAWDQVAWEVNRQIGRRAFFQTGACIQTRINRVLARLENDPESVSTSIRELASQYSALLPSPPTKRQSRSPTTAESASSLSLNLVGPEASKPSPQGDLHTEQHLASGVKAEMALLRELITRLSDQVTILTRDAANTSNELAEARAETKQLVEEFKLERREVREQENALVELLRSEREAQRCETRAMLDAIDRERKDRRDEFIAMANLLTHSVPPAAVTQDNH